MLSTWFNVAYVIYTTLGKLNVASKTVSMKIDVQHSTSNYIHTAISEHFLSNNHSDTHMLLIPTEKLKNERDSFRKARNAHIIHKANTLEPVGINKRDEL